MPKRKKPGKSESRVSKAQAIRDYKKANPNAMPRAIAEVMNGQGLNCTPQYVSMILSNERRKGAPVGKPGRPALSSSSGNSRPAKKSTTSNDELSIDDLLIAKKFVAEVGDVEKARAAMNAFAKLAQGI